MINKSVIQRSKKIKIKFYINTKIFGNITKIKKLKQKKQKCKADALLLTAYFFFSIAQLTPFTIFNILDIYFL